MCNARENKVKTQLEQVRKARTSQEEGLALAVYLILESAGASPSS
jgi:hypothetical protein